MINPISKFSKNEFFSIRWKFLIVGIFLVAIPTIILGLFVYQTYRQEALRNTGRDLALIAKGWYTTTDVYYQQMNRILKRERYSVEKRLEVILKNIEGMIELSDQIGGTQEVLFDQIAKIKIGRSGYVFILDQEGRYIVSRGRKFDGQMAVDFGGANTKQGYAEIIQAALNQKIGEIDTYDYDWKEPIDDDFRRKKTALMRLKGRDWIVGVGIYDTDFKSFGLERLMQTELEDKIAAQEIGDEGYIWVLNSKGYYVVSKKRLRDGEYLGDAQGADGSFFIQNIISRAQGILDGEPVIMEYFWRNFGEKKATPKIAAVIFHEGWGWVIGASIYETEFLKGLAEIRFQIIRVCVLFIVLGSLLVLFLTSLVSKPIRKLEELVSSGSLEIDVDQDILLQKDEIGSLAKAFSAMMKRLKEKIEEIEFSRLQLMQTNQKLIQTQDELVGVNNFLRERETELENLLHELELAQERMVQAEKLASLGQLSAGVAHEINNPLAFVMSNIEIMRDYFQSYSRLLKRGPDLAEDTFLADQEMPALLKETEEGLERIKRIVDDLRIFARGDYFLSTEDVYLCDVIEQAITILKGRINPSIVIKKDYEVLSAVKGDSQRLVQVFLNIILNAVQSIKGEGEISIKMYSSFDDVLVEIKDTGCGIPQDKLNRVFDAFFTTKKIGEGTGLGLSISHEIINQHGGSLSISSEVGKGTLLIVRFPKK